MNQHGRLSRKYLIALLKNALHENMQNMLNCSINQNFTKNNNTEVQKSTKVICLLNLCRQTGLCPKRSI